MLGGVAYLRRPPAAADAAAIFTVLAAWQKSPRAEALRGREWIADQLFTYPPADAAFTADAEAAPAIEAALTRLTQLATPSGAPATPTATGATIILATVTRFPDRRFVPALSALETAAQASSGWRHAGAIATGLLDLLDPERTIGGGRARASE